MSVLTVIALLASAFIQGYSNEVIRQRQLGLIPVESKETVVIKEVKTEEQKKKEAFDELTRF